MTGRKVGRFISLEGGEGAGKSTQSRLLLESFERAGIPAILTREPGGSEGAESIRSLIVTGSQARWSATTETLLVMAARSDHLERTIHPALADGKIVICDRFLDSTRIYQGIAKKLGQPWVDAMHRLCFGDTLPELTLYLDIDPAQGLARTAARAGNETRFEGMDIAFHTQLREGFLALHAKEPARIARIDATLPPEQVHQAITATINQRLGVAL